MTCNIVKAKACRRINNFSKLADNTLDTGSKSNVLKTRFTSCVHRVKYYKNYEVPQNGILPTNLQDRPFL